MNYPCQTLVRLMLVFALLNGFTQPIVAAPSNQPAAPKVSMDLVSMALVVGAEWGDGILTMPDGKQHRFTIRGLELGSVGTSFIFLKGKVYHLSKIEDLDGVYGTFEGAMSLIEGPGGMAMRNRHGVVITMEAVEKGAEVTLGVAGIEIKLEE